MPALKRAWSFVAKTYRRVFPKKEPTVNTVVDPLLKRGALVESVSKLQGSGASPRKFTVLFFFPPGFKLDDKTVMKISRAVPHPLVTEASTGGGGIECGFETRGRHETADAAHAMLVAKAREHKPIIAGHRDAETREEEPD